MSIFTSALLAAAGLVSQPADAPPPEPVAAVHREVIGRSVQGRPIRALRIGSPRARVKLMAVGAVHGNEPAGRAVVERLRGARPPRGTALWLIEDANPDGSAAGARHNAAVWT